MGWPILLPLTGNEPWNLRKALLKAHVSEKGFVVVVQPADRFWGPWSGRGTNYVRFTEF